MINNINFNFINLFLSQSAAVEVKQLRQRMESLSHQWSDVKKIKGFSAGRRMGAQTYFTTVTKTSSSGWVIKSIFYPDPYFLN